MMESNVQVTRKLTLVLAEAEIDWLKKMVNRPVTESDDTMDMTMREAFNKAIEEAEPGPHVPHKPSKPASPKHEEKKETKAAPAPPKEPPAPPKK